MDKTRTTKVLYLLNGAFMGGATISFFNMVDGLTAYGISPVVCVSRRQPTDERFFQQLEKRNIPYHRIVMTTSSLPRPTGFVSLLRTAVSFVLMLAVRQISYFQLLGIARKEQPQIVHTNVGMIHEGLRVARWLGIPHVLHIREYQDKDFGWLFVPSKKGFERFVNRSDAVVTITDDLRRYFHLENEAKATTVYNGIYRKDDTRFAEGREKRFVCASRIVPSKGFEDIIAAFSTFHKHHPDYELHIAGQGDKDYVRRLKDAAEKGQCADSVRFLGHLDDVRSFMAESKALIVGSHNEGFGRMTAEACFNGCLVIGRATGGTKEILQTTGGFMFGTTDSLVEQMENVVALTPEQYRQQALAAQQAAVGLYSTESNASAIANIYNNLTET